MNILPSKLRQKRGLALLVVLGLLAVSLTAMTGALSWTSSSTRQSMANTRFFTATSAAEAATEKVLARLLTDYLNLGEADVYNNLQTYRQLVPSTGESAFWQDFQFSDGAGNNASTYVERVKAAAFVNLDSQYEGLKGWASTYRIMSNARLNDAGRYSIAAVAQDVQTASIPIFQFAIFYNLDLELHSMTTMDIRGRVHSNRHIYTYPSATTTFWADTTAVGDFIKLRKQGDPDFSTSPAKGKLIYKAKKDAKVASLSLPIGTNNSPDAVREVILIPPAGEAINTAMGKQRYYNKAELVIMVTNNQVTAFAKAPLSSTTFSVPWNNLTHLITTNDSFTDQREGKTIKVTEIDVSKIQAWSITNSAVTNALGANKPVNLIYVADNRSLSAGQLAGVRLVNGATLPERGLTVATPNPLYVLGHYNAPTVAHRGTTNTTNTKAASLVSDALTLLSGSWDDGKSSQSYTSRDAVNTTVNAAILTGIVETKTNPSMYSGGAHNLGRFLEDWSGRTLTYNGSMVVLFNSIKATAPFQQPGAYYDPPNRAFAFDLNFMDGTKLPPGTPDLRGLIRNQWAVVPPGTTALGEKLVNF